MHIVSKETLPAVDLLRRLTLLCAATRHPTQTNHAADSRNWLWCGACVPWLVALLELPERRLGASRLVLHSLGPGGHKTGMGAAGAVLRERCKSEAL